MHPIYVCEMADYWRYILIVLQFSFVTHNKSKTDQLDTAFTNVSKRRILQLNINRNVEQLIYTFMYHINILDEVIVQHKSVEREIARRILTRNI